MWANLVGTAHPTILERGVVMHFGRWVSFTRQLRFLENWGGRIKKNEGGNFGE
jgi:hypothetical protein